jgi:hypothetical protein
MSVLVVDGADATEVLIVFADFQHSLSGHVFTTQNVLQKWHDVVWSFGSAK